MGRERGAGLLPVMTSPARHETLEDIPQEQVSNGKEPTQPAACHALMGPKQGGRP